MNQAALIPLFALATWILALYADNKFRVFYEGKDARLLARNTTGLRRFVILRNRELKYLGLGLLWAGFSIGVVLSNGPDGVLSKIAYTVGIIGLLTYVASRVWPFLSR